MKYCTNDLQLSFDRITRKVQLNLLNATTYVNPKVVAATSQFRIEDLRKFSLYIL
jgi:hypothetical protein